jgi:uncharacterized protein YerC
MPRKIKNTERWKEDKLIKKGVCFECGSIESIHYHHVVPEVKGGKNTLPLCYICHGKVHDKNFKNYRELQRIGIEKAKAEGKFIGRVRGSVETEEKFLNKEKNKEIIKLLLEKKSFRYIASTLNASSTTISKVANIYGKKNNIASFKKLSKKVERDNKKYMIPDWMNDV